MPDCNNGPILSVFHLSSMIPYRCLSTGSSIGMIEVVYQAETLAKLQKTKGVTAAFGKDSIWDWLKIYNVTDERFGF